MISTAEKGSFAGLQRIEGGEQTRIASSIRSSRFSAASIRALAEIGLEGFQSRENRLSLSEDVSLLRTSEDNVIPSDSLFGIKADANCSTLFAVSASIARLKVDSFPAMKIPLVIYTVYILPSFVAISIHEP